MDLAHTQNVIVLTRAEIEPTIYITLALQSRHCIDESILSTMKTIVKFNIKIISGTIEFGCSIINYYLFISSVMSPMSPR
jgi:hypothetical protein